MKRCVVYVAVLALMCGCSGSGRGQHDVGYYVEMIGRGTVLEEADYVAMVSYLEADFGQLAEMFDDAVKSGICVYDAREALSADSVYCELSTRATLIEDELLRYMKDVPAAVDLRREYDRMLRRSMKKAEKSGMLRRPAVRRD